MGPPAGHCPRPLLALAGTDDIRFAAHALRMAALAPLGVASLVPAGGHAVHLAQPDHAWRVVAALAGRRRPDGGRLSAHSSSPMVRRMPTAS